MRVRRGRLLAALPMIIVIAVMFAPVLLAMYAWQAWKVATRE